jgi:hypothetical protein
MFIYMYIICNVALPLYLLNLWATLKCFIENKLRTKKSVPDVISKSYRKPYNIYSFNPIKMD